MPAGYRIVVYRRIDKDIAGIPRRIQDSIRERIRGLAVDPRPPGAVRLQGQQQGETYHRIRVGDYRIIYDVDDAASQVRIILVGHRRDIYEQFRRR